MHMITSAKDALNRGFNLLAVSITALAGFAFLPEAFLEKDIPDKFDDSLLFIIGIIGMAWYAKTSNRTARSIIPLVLVVLALLVKIMAVIIEFDDAESVGDDFGGLILFVLAVGLVVYQWRKTAKLIGQIPQK